MNEPYFKKNQYIREAQRYNKIRKINYGNIETAKDNARTFSKTNPPNNRPVTVTTKDDTKAKNDNDNQVGKFEESLGGQFKEPAGGQFIQSQGGNFEESLGGQFKEPAGGQFMQSQDGNFKESLGDQFKEPAGGQFMQSQDGNFKESLGGQFMQSQGGNFKESLGGQFKHYQSSLFTGDQDNLNNNEGGQFDNSFRVQQTQVQLFNVVGDTDIVKYILKNGTQSVISNQNMDINPTQTNAIQPPARGTYSQDPVKFSKMWNQDKTVVRRLLEIQDENEPGHDPNHNQGIQMTCTKDGFMNFKNMPFQITNTIIAVKAVASNGQIWNWVGEINSNEFLIPLSSVSVLDILYHKTSLIRNQATRVYVPWMPSASAGGCKNVTSASGEWHGARISVSPKGGGINEVLEVVPDMGMRITRIVTTETTNVRAMQLLSVAKTRMEVMSVCLKFRDECIQRDHNTLSQTRSWMGWNRVELENSLHSPKSIMWVVDLKRSGECQVQLGSWLLASMQLKDNNKLSALFTETAERVCQSPQAMVLIRPGNAWPNLQAHRPRDTWSITFVELQKVNSWGQVPE